MKLFIWEDVEELTSAWHDGGGLVVVARDEARAIEVAVESIAADRIDSPDWTYELAEDNREENVFVFPDQGCC